MLYKIMILVQVISAIAIIGVVLLQHGKGADMGAAFGAGASGSLFGATGSSNFLSKSTAIAAVIFFSVTLAISYIGNKRAPEQNSVIEKLQAVPDGQVADKEAAPDPGAGAQGISSIPGAVPGVPDTQPAQKAK